jgi:3-hydroxy-9,10-secoandrosta-1,3,5(10)-triene-9,17-dione monooxygenase
MAANPAGTSTRNQLLSQGLLPDIAAQAETADRTRSVAPSVIEAIKASDLMGLTASENLGGRAARVADVAAELEAVAGACASTAWCLWNHLSVFHFYCGLLGPDHLELLGGITAAGEWVSLPAGAGTSIQGVTDGDAVVVTGDAHFGSGARYGEWVGITFMLDDERIPRFTIARSSEPGVRIDPTWNGMSLRASATDNLYYEGLRVPASRVVPFLPKYRVRFRDPNYPVIDHRYREDWVALSDLWLGAMAVGVAQAALDEACAGIQNRIAIMGTKMVERPTIHVNLGQAGAAINAARAAVNTACAETDVRIEAVQSPDEDDYLRQLAASMTALRLCGEAMQLILRVLGGNGLRESASFERRFRDYQAMPLHINAHPDRVSEAYGRHLLGLPTENAF